MTGQQARRSLRAAALAGQIQGGPTGAEAEHRAAVLARVDAEGAATTDQLREATGLARQGVYPVLDGLVAEGVLVRVRAGLYRRATAP